MVVELAIFAGVAAAAGPPSPDVVGQTVLLEHRAAGGGGGAGQNARRGGKMTDPKEQKDDLGELELDTETVGWLRGRPSGGFALKAS